MNTQNKTTKRLKKVDKIKEFTINALKLNAEVDAAYQEKNGYKIDEATENILSYLKEQVGETNPYYTAIKNFTWQKNHLRILASISNLSQTLNRMPATGEISEDAGLSHETVYKHLREAKNHELYQHEKEKFRFMELKILNKLFNLGVQGDVRACKVYLDYLGPTMEGRTSNYQQNNYIQFNNLKLSVEDISNLPMEVQSEIEKLILRR